MIQRHPNVWDYTPAQAIAFLRLAEKRERHERAQQLQLQTMAARGDHKEVGRQIRRDWGD